MDDEEGYEQDFDAASEPTPRAEAPAESAASVLSGSPPPTPPARSPAAHDSYASPIVRPPTRPSPAPRKPVRSALDQAPWFFSVHAKRIRSLRVPVASPAAPAVGGLPAIGDLRVFATLDKQPMQTQASRWKQETRIADTARPLVKVRRAPSPSSARSPGRRSGMLQEAAWKKGDGDLQWALTMDRFRRLKAYSPRVKLFVFGIGVNAQAESVRELSEDSPRAHRDSIVSLGWFFLDLRTPDLPERWFKLQNSPFGGEIFVSTSFTPVEGGRNQVDSSHHVQTSQSYGLPNRQPTQRREHVTSADSEYLQLGKRHGSDVFMFTLFIRGATNLVDVVRSCVRTKEEERKALGSGFWLSYSLFGVVVQTDIFYNLERAEFAPIRDSFRVLSSKSDVHEFLETQGHLSIYLCTHDRVLANADILFTKMIGAGSFLVEGSEEEQATIEDTFPFGTNLKGGVVASFSIAKHANLTEREHSVDAEASSLAHSITASSLKTEKGDYRSIVISVRYVKLSSKLLRSYAEKESIELEVVLGEQAVRCPIRFNAFTPEHSLGECPDILLNGHACTNDETLAVSVACYTSATDLEIAFSTEARHRNTGEDVQLSLSHDGSIVGECVLHVGDESPTTRRIDGGKELFNASIPGVSRAYRLLIRLRSLRDFETSHGIVLSYTNPFSGHELVETPLISVAGKAEVDIPDAYCMFVLYHDESSMKDAMEMPLVLEVAIVLPDGSREVIGSAVFSLNFLYYSPETHCCAVPGCEAAFRTIQEASQHWWDSHQDPKEDEIFKVTLSRRMCSIYLPIIRADGGRRHLNPFIRAGGIQLEACLEDTGPMSDTEVRLVEEMRVPQSILQDEWWLGWRNVESTVLLEPQMQGVREGERTQPSKTDVKPTSDPIRDTVSRSHVEEVENDLDEIKAQLLEEQTTWLQEHKAQQAQWRIRVAEIEKARMDELEDEWARREEERSFALRSAQEEYHKLELKLRETLSEVEARERKLALAEAALERDQRMFKEDSELLRKRLQAEQSHSVSLAQQQVVALEKRVADLQRHLEAAEKRTSQVENDFAEYRKQQRKLPESKLRGEISSLQIQISELEKARASETTARKLAEANVEKMKTQLERMAKLVQREKKKTEARAIDEIEKLRLKYIAREERFVLDGDRQELRAIKQQLDELRRLQLGGLRDDIESPHRQKLRVSSRRKFHIPSSSPSKSSSQQHAEIRRSWGSSESFPLAEEEQGNRDRCNNEDYDHNDQEIRRLKSERDALLASGTYDHNSYLVRELERRIILRQNMLGQ